VVPSSPSSPATSQGPLALEALNEPQARAVAHHEGPLLVFAGAGSGKTRVIVYRIANLVATHRVPPYRVLAVTFTNKAAREMRSRLEGLLGAELVKELWVGTFHATCMRLLRTHHAAAGLDRQFVIYDDSDQRSVMARVLRELDVDDKRFPVKQVLGRIHKEKQEGRSATDMESKGFFDDVVKKCFVAYEEHLARASALDFDDILLRVLRLVEDPESLAGESIRRRFWHVLVDEFQDVNQVQYRLVRKLASHVGQGGSLCVVGDDDQSIYRWRGADVRIVRGFRRDHANAVVVKLEENYRSSANVVSAALGVIKPSAEREPKELWTSNPAGEKVRVIACDTEHDEAALVAEGVHALVREGTSPRDIAVFYRTHAQSRVLEEVFRQERIPYQIVGGLRFFDRAEVKDALAYLRVLANPKSDVDLQRIINVPSRKIGAATVERLASFAVERGVSMAEALEPLVLSGTLAPPAKRALMAFQAVLGVLREKAKSRKPSEVLEAVLEDTGYKKLLLADDDAESEARLLNLGELLQSVRDYEDQLESAGEVATLDGYLETITLSSDQDTLEEVPRVPMMTVHASKGLEFEAVFLTGMEEDLFPFKSMDALRVRDLEEERRLAYVAITRARRRLVATHAARRAVFGQTRYNVPSRFLGDLPRDAVEGDLTASAKLRLSPHSSPPAGPRREGPWVHPMNRAHQAGSVGLPSPAQAPQRQPGERFVERDMPDRARGVFEVGDVVEHERFGRGVVEAVEGGADPTVRVAFRGFGTRSIKARFLGPR
jgi:DNA helicase-2/ATP-dependent DNA helicase PcrA